MSILFVLLLPIMVSMVYVLVQGTIALVQCVWGVYTNHAIIKGAMSILNNKGV